MANETTSRIFHYQTLTSWLSAFYVRLSVGQPQIMCTRSRVVEPNQIKSFKYIQINNFFVVVVGSGFHLHRAHHPGFDNTPNQFIMHRDSFWWPSFSRQYKHTNSSVNSNIPSFHLLHKICIPNTNILLYNISNEWNFWFWCLMFNILEFEHSLCHFLIKDSTFNVWNWISIFIVYSTMSKLFTEFPIQFIYSLFAACGCVWVFASVFIYLLFSLWHLPLSNAQQLD